ncbi:hypothetical protein [Selenomonas ruminantium]|uniref:Uncharacterized protein n=1 Tax=Selenomonas ruminantium TaxID=971 RepID=A0A1H3VSK3_SELRU|nr:hypothetical protein [Selenomonas ruminantium]SDZ77078.1 hypothetical protein SAMN05660648_00488 [Selenomonas ruminantium]
MNKLKHIVLVLVAVISVSLSLMVNSADAANVELTKKFLKDWHNGKQTFGDMSEVETRQQTYEDDSMSILIQPLFDTQAITGVGRIRNTVNSKYDNVIFTVDQAPFSGTAGIFSVYGISITVQNKTNQVMVVDLNESAVSLGSYYGRPITMGVRYVEMQSAKLSPMLIPPKGKASQQWMRGDYTFVSKGVKSGWVHPLDMKLGENIFGTGQFILSVGNKTDSHFVTVPVRMIFTEESLRAYIKQRK